MASLGKCKKCGKTVYGLEGLVVAKNAFHNSCFKCENSGCGWKLNLNNYKSIDDKVYCSNHYPVTGFSVDQRVVGTSKTNDVLMSNQINAPKGSTVNDQIRGDGDKPNIGTDSMNISKATSAPKLDVVNQQIRGDGDKPNIGTDSINISKATSAPKLDVVNQQIRGESKSNVGIDSINISKATSAPKLDVQSGYQKATI
ncbi:hypothetical protein CYY_006778 [Polysphondylium violaceum]|uniref:LIM zinc-binding domain-containing protein n=1 Tax=Polysphondylium violaceum TaxID=133409 RepID=A0A8J4PSW3_9MYCE|nr:hypothetical protein CYY_006778 [Polysphondylium violaceum]